MTMKLYLTILLLAGIPFRSLGQTSLQGAVLNESGEPLEGAEVAIPQLKAGTVTTASGAYLIDNIPPGEYVVTFSYLGFATEKKRIKSGDLQTTLRLDVRLSAKSILLTQLEVSATRAPEHSPFTFTNLKKETLSSGDFGQDAPYAMQWTPSAVVTSDAGAGVGYTGIRIRGTDPSRINVTINGIPVNDAESQQVYWVDLPDVISSAQEIQIQRGVGTSTNGAGAFGATVNLKTNQINTEPFARLNLGAGSFNTFRRNIQFGSGLLNRQFSVQGRLSRITSDGYIDRATADLNSYFLSAAYLGDRSSLQLITFSGHEKTYQAWYGVPANLVSDPKLRTFNPAGAEKPGDPYDNQVDDYTQTHYQLHFFQELSPAWTLNTALHYTRGAGFYEEYKAGENLENYDLDPVNIGDTTIFSSDLIRRRWLDNHFYGMTYSLRYLNPGSSLNFTLGGAYNRYDGRHFGEVIWSQFASNGTIRHPYYDNDALKSDLNLYAKADFRVNTRLNSFIDLQWRRVDYTFLGLTDQLERVEQQKTLDFINPKAGISYQVNARANLYLSAGVAQREPNRDDYVNNLRSQQPKVEKLINLETGYRVKTLRTALEANIYYMYYKDQLALNGQINDNGAYIRVNIPESYRIGLELNGQTSLSARLRISANTTLSKNKIRSFTEYLDTFDESFNWTGQTAIPRNNTGLAFSPEWTAAGEIAWVPVGEKTRHELEFSLLGKYVGKQYLDNSSDESNILRAYYYSDIRAKLTLRPKGFKEMVFSLAVNNWTNHWYESNGWSYRYRFGNEAYVDSGFYPQAGRHFLAGAVLVF